MTIGLNVSFIPFMLENISKDKTDFPYVQRNDSNQTEWIPVRFDTFGFIVCQSSSSPSLPPSSPFVLCWLSLLLSLSLVGAVLLLLLLLLTQSVHVYGKKDLDTSAIGGMVTGNAIAAATACFTTMWIHIWQMRVLYFAVAFHQTHTCTSLTHTHKDAYAGIHFSHCFSSLFWTCLVSICSCDCRTFSVCWYPRGTCFYSHCALKSAIVFWFYHRLLLVHLSWRTRVTQKVYTFKAKCALIQYNIHWLLFCLAARIQQKMSTLEIVSVSIGFSNRKLWKKSWNEISLQKFNIKFHVADIRCANL